MRNKEKDTDLCSIFFLLKIVSLDKNKEQQEFLVDDRRSGGVLAGFGWQMVVMADSTVESQRH